MRARSDYRAAAGKLAAFGLDDNAIESLRKQQLEKPGEYTLVAANAGVVLAGDFHQGQRVTAGDTLLTLASEGELWVEARLSPDSLIQLPRDTQAVVRVAGEEFPARVAQEAHAIDPRTRTRIVRLLVDNRAYRLHPGMLADVYFLLQTPKAVLALPESVLVRGAFFVESEGTKSGFDPHNH